MEGMRKLLVDLLAKSSDLVAENERLKKRVNSLESDLKNANHWTDYYKNIVSKQTR